MQDAPELDDFSYDDDSHTYRNSADIVRPSVTETLKYGGLFNYDRVPVDKLERKRVIGKNVHAWTARFDREEVGPDDTLDLTLEEAGYAAGWPKFRAAWSNLTILDVELPMLRKIGALEVGGTPDRRVRIGTRIYILDIKCVAAFNVAWRLQLADYVMMLTGRSTCSMYGRMIVRLLSDGTFRVDFIDPAHDEADSAAALGFVQTYVWKKNWRVIR